MSNIRIDGLPELVATLERVGGKEFAEAVVKPALLHGAEDILQEARMLAPVKTGALRRSLIAELSDKPGLLRAFMAVDFDETEKTDRKGKKIRYPYIVEHGSAAHKIKAGRGNFLLIGGNRFLRSVRHPGFAAVHYFRRAVNARRRAVPIQVVNEISLGLRAKLAAGRAVPAV